MEVSYLDLVKHGFLSQFIVHAYFISEKRKLSITNKNKKATFEVFAINLLHGRKTKRILPNPGVLANSGLHVFRFVSFSLA